MKAIPTEHRFCIHTLPAKAVLAAIVIAVLAPAGLSQQDSPSPRSEDQKKEYRRAMEDADQKVAAEVKAHSELMKNLEYLTTSIGPRLTGSPQMQAASEWTLRRFRDYGIDAHLETAQIAHGWTRGNDRAEIVSPISRRVTIHSLGWGKATNGVVTGPVLVLDVKSPSDLDRYKGRLKGAIVLPRKPQEVPGDSDNPANAYDAVIPPERGLPHPHMSYREQFQMLMGMAESGVAAVLLDSGKTDSLFNMAGGFGQYQPSPAPLGFITHEDYDLISRLSQSGPVSMNVSLAGTFSPGPAPASITVAEIRGSEFPDQRVIIGGHLDSWDLGQGALDNGTGSMAVLEAARALKALGWKPKRTLTFILFTGEEQGGIGAETFLKNHQAEVPKMDGLLIHDTGTGRVFSIGLEDLYETAPLMMEIYKPLQEVFELQPLSTRNFGGSDHVPFLSAGVPAYFCVQEPAHYRQAHHSQADTFDKVIADQINQGAALLAAWAWNVSEMPAPLPHHAAIAKHGLLD
jgi:carboxypeptidase Q